jgi:hypothetical protein
MWTDFIWSRIGTSDGLLWAQEWTYRFKDRQRISWLAEWLLASCSQWGLCSLELVCYSLLMSASGSVRIWQIVGCIPLVVQSGSKLLSEFPWPVNTNSENNLESPCAIQIQRCVTFLQGLAEGSTWNSKNYLLGMCSDSRHVQGYYSTAQLHT